MEGKESRYKAGISPPEHRDGRAFPAAPAPSRTGRRRRKHPFSLALEAAYSGLRQGTFLYQNPARSLSDLSPGQLA